MSLLRLAMSRFLKEKHAVMIHFYWKTTLYREKVEEKKEILYLSGWCKVCHYIDFDVIYNMSSSLHDVGYNLTTHDDTMYLRYDIRSKTQVIKKKVWNEYFIWRSKDHGLPHT